MNELIIIAGDLAAGKSTLADYLSNKMGIPCFQKDHVKERLSDIIGFSNREENLKLSKAAVSALVEIFKENAKVGFSLILESNFHTNELLEIKEIADTYGYKVCLLRIEADIEVLYQRFVKRAPTRHKTHLTTNLEGSYEAFKAYTEKLRNEDSVFPKHVIFTTGSNIEATYEKAASIIEAAFAN